jgi:hypothetical protein
LASSQSTIAAISAAPKAVARWLGHELAAMAPAALFFLVGFALILLILKLFVAEYSIELRVISNAVVGALFAAKVSLLLDQRDWARAHRYPRAVVVAGKIVLYTVTVIVLGIIEHLIEDYRASGSLSGALVMFQQHFNRARFFAVVLCVAMLFAVFFVMQEVNRKMGPGQMYALFFARPRA